MTKSFTLKGDICYSKDLATLVTAENSYLVCEDGVSKGVFSVLPEKYSNLPSFDYSGCVIIPGLVDLHIHASQFSFRALGMDLELLDWLNEHTFPEEAKYRDLDYAEKAYSMFVRELKRGPNTRACIFATVHSEASILLMDMLEQTGLVTMVGKVSMDRNCPDNLKETGSGENTRLWLENCLGKFKNTSPILTPRFIPACTDELMMSLGGLQREYGLPVQSHLSENQGEIEWVKKLCPSSKFYGDAYDRFGLFGGCSAPAVTAHCTWSNDEESGLMRKNGVYVAHCPQSNMNLASGIAPLRKFIRGGLNIGLGSDVAGGCHMSIFRAMSDAIQASKLYWRLVDQNDEPVIVSEAFYLGTLGGGGFFGKVGSFDDGYEFDAVIIDDRSLSPLYGLTVEERLARIIYLSDDRHILAKYARGEQIGRCDDD